MKYNTTKYPNGSQKAVGTREEKEFFGGGVGHKNLGLRFSSLLEC